MCIQWRLGWPQFLSRDDFTPAWQACFALRLRVRLKQFKQLYVVHVLIICFVVLVTLRVTCSPRSTLFAHDSNRHGKQRVSTFFLVWKGNFWIVEQLVPLVVEQLLNPILSIMFQGDLWKRPRWRMYFLVHDFSSFHPNNFRNSISWERFVKNDCVRSCFIELQSFFQSKIDVDPIHRILMFLPCFVHGLCMTRCFQVDRIRILMTFVHGFHRQKEYCLSVAQTLSSTRCQSWIPDEVKIDCTPDMIHVLEEIARNNNIVL